MKKLFTLALLAMATMCVWAAEKIDVIPGSLPLTASYSQQVLECESGASWIVLLKNEGDGPQMKPGSGGIVTKTSIGLVRKIEVTWGSKSNEDIVVFGSHEPIADPKTITGTELGTVTFSAGATTSLEISGDWEYVGMTATAKKGKACQFASMSVVWETSGEDPDPDPQTGLILNEVCGDDGRAMDGSEDWIEIANASDHTISYNLITLVKVNEDGSEDVLYTTPVTEDIKELKAGEYLLVKRTMDFEAGISNSKNIIIKLISANGNVIDKFDKRVALTDNGHHKKGGSYSRIPNFTGDWAIVQNATPGAANDATPVAAVMKRFQLVTSADELVEDMKFILVNETADKTFVMSSSWATTKDGGLYLMAENADALDCETPMVDADVNRVAVITLKAAADGQWGLLLAETGNYKNDNLYIACTAFKNIDFKKSVDKKGVPCTITFNEGGDAEISYGELAGSLKFNYKGDGSDRFLNYDPLDKPEDHLAVKIFKEVGEGVPNLIGSISKENIRSAAIYNLAGQKVSADYRGIVIRNGRKMLQK